MHSREVDIQDEAGLFFLGRVSKGKVSVDSDRIY